MRGRIGSGKGGRDKRVWSQPQENPSPERGQSSQPKVCRSHGNIEELTNLIELDEGPIQRYRQC